VLVVAAAIPADAAAQDFTPNRPGSLVPCSRQCSKTPNVHLKCIYEWQAQSEGGGPNTCPLCRSPLERVDYEPPDLLASHTLFMTSARRTFCSRPAPRGAGMIRCYIQVVGTGCVTSTPLKVRARCPVPGERQLTRAHRTQYEMFLQAPHSRLYPNNPVNKGQGPDPGDSLLMSARRATSLKGRSVISISLDREGRDFSPKSPNLLGRVLSNLSGLDYTVTAPYRFDGLTPFSGSRYVELGSLHFAQNRIGSYAGPRRLKVCLPQVREDASTLTPWPPSATAPRLSRPEGPAAAAVVARGDGALEEDDDSVNVQYSTAAHDPHSRKDTLRHVLRQGPVSGAEKRFIFARNVQPYFVEELQAYSLDFSGRVTLPSNKNFILACDSDPNSKCLVFGKVSVAGVLGAEYTAYTLDFEWPLSPLQAFGIALSSCDRKLGCA
jgi:hypothetical protein